MATFLPAYPELLLSILCFAFLLLVHRRRSSRGLLTNWPIVGMLPGLAVNIPRLHDFASDILDPAGGSFLFHGPRFSGMKFLVTCDPANVNHVFTVNFQNYPKGHEFADIFDLLGDGIFNTDGKSWRNQRKKAQLLMAHPRFRAFVARCSRDKVKNSLLPLLRQISEQGKKVDLQDIFLRLTFDITCNLVFGTDPASLSPEFPIVPFAKAMDDAMTAILYRHAVPVSWWKLMRRLNLWRERQLSEAWCVIDDFIAENISMRKAEISRGGDLVGDNLLTAYIEDSATAGSGSGNKFLRDTMVNFMLAGRDTTGSALAWFFYLLSRNQDAEAKLLEELRRAGRDGSGEESVEGLVYLHASLCEALRLYPPVPFESKGVVAPDILPSGDRVEPEMQVLFSTYTMGRMEWVWGKDCLEFRPERWITDQGMLRHEPAYKFMSFNCGPRTCLGKDIAFMQLKAAAAAVVKEFRVEIVEGHVVKPKLSIILQMSNGLLVKLIRREGSSSVMWVD